jgi:hypothetical protein
MNPSLKIEKFSLGVGDRFARQANAQLRACIMAAQQGVEIVPVWNKSNREHRNLTGGRPRSRKMSPTTFTSDTSNRCSSAGQKIPEPAVQTAST